VPYGDRGGGRAAQRPNSRRRARGGAVSLRFSGGCLLALFALPAAFGAAVSKRGPRE